MDDLSDMVSTVFLAHSGANLQTHDHLNLSSIATAAEISVQSFFMQARRWTYLVLMHGRLRRHALFLCACGNHALFITPYMSIVHL